MQIEAKATKRELELRERARELNMGFESAMLLSAFEENLTNIMQLVKEINRGEHAGHVEEAVIARYRDAKATLGLLNKRIDTFNTILEVIEYDLLESTRA
jgi:hypothetical protein